MILKSKETKETRIFLGEEERRRRRKKGPIESRVHELKIIHKRLNNNNQYRRNLIYNSLEIQYEQVHLLRLTNIVN